MPRPSWRFTTIHPAILPPARMIARYPGAAAGLRFVGYLAARSHRHRRQRLLQLRRAPAPMKPHLPHSQNRGTGPQFLPAIKAEKQDESDLLPAQWPEFGFLIRILPKRGPQLPCTGVSRGPTYSSTPDYGVPAGLDLAFLNALDLRPSWRGGKPIYYITTETNSPPRRLHSSLRPLPPEEREGKEAAPRHHL